LVVPTGIGTKTLRTEKEAPFSVFPSCLRKRWLFPGMLLKSISGARVTLELEFFGFVNSNL